METNAAEASAIKEAILKYYSEAHVTGESGLYKEILHPEWRFFLLESGNFRIIDRSEYMTFYGPERVDPRLHWETEFFSVDVYAHLASVKLRLENEKVKYTDYFNMMKLDGRWWIVHKMSFPEEKS
ncbi:MAG: nuclear transport factor 2 family protein [Anaerolineales bacterium]|nr:nuclear transport factor 2 family protein [Anaerolineales bacterium]